MITIHNPVHNETYNQLLACSPDDEKFKIELFNFIRIIPDKDMDVERFNLNEKEDYIQQIEDFFNLEYIKSHEHWAPREFRYIGIKKNPNYNYNYNSDSNSDSNSDYRLVGFKHISIAPVDLMYSELLELLDIQKKDNPDIGLGRHILHNESLTQMEIL